MSAQLALRTVTCAFCDASQPSVEVAILAGWEPSYYEFDAWIEGDSETGYPVCPHCIEKHLAYHEGELVQMPRPTAFTVRKLGITLEQDLGLVDGVDYSTTLKEGVLRITCPKHFKQRITQICENAKIAVCQFLTY